MTTELGQLIGGLGLLLLALSLMTNGLQVAAGSRLTRILKKSTTPAWRGLLSGFSVTAIVQSSSAVTVAAVGFVNAGLMSLDQAVAVVFGTNIGTTVTGWLVSALGFEIRLSVLALPLIGLGMAARLVFGEHPRAGFGTATAGFGLFFLGLEFLKLGFSGVGPSLNLQIVSDYGALGVLMAVGIGFVVTALAQSSSVAIALVLTAAAGGAVMLPSAMAMVVGANIGTSSTAVLAAIGATSNARRVALAHVAFNGLTGIVATVLLIASLPFADRLAGLGAPATLLAGFHTAFNIMGVALVWHGRKRLVAFLETRFRTREEDMLKPQFLDGTLAGTPDLALQAAQRELARLDGHLATLIAQAFDEKETDHPELEHTWMAVRTLVAQIYDFVSAVQQGSMAPDVADGLSSILRISQYYLETAHLTVQAKGLRAAIRRLDNPQVRRACSRFVNQIAPTVGRAGQEPAPLIAALPAEVTDKIEAGYHDLRAELLAAVMHHEVEPVAVNEVLEILSTINRLVARLAKAGGLLNKLARTTRNGNGEAESIKDARQELENKQETAGE